MNRFLIAALLLTATARATEKTQAPALPVTTELGREASSSLRITQPTDRAIFQRDEHGVVEVPVVDFVIKHASVERAE